MSNQFPNLCRQMGEWSGMIISGVRCLLINDETSQEAWHLHSSLQTQTHIREFKSLFSIHLAPWPLGILAHNSSWE